MPNKLVQPDDDTTPADDDSSLLEDAFRRYSKWWNAGGVSQYLTGRFHRDTGFTPEEAAMGFGTDAGGAGAGIIAGKNALTANKNMLALANVMQRRGAHPDEIYDKTGWWQGADKQWRFEIPDPPATNYKPGVALLNAVEQDRPVWEDTGSRDPGTALYPDFRRLQYMEFLKNKLGFTTPVGGIYDHPELFAAYPQLQAYDVNVGNPKLAGTNTLGQFHTGKQGLSLSPDIAYSLERGHSTLSHELQHGIQELEGFGYGTSPEWLASGDPLTGGAQIEKAYPELKDFRTQQLLPIFHKRAAMIRDLIDNQGVHPFDAETIANNETGYGELRDRYWKAVDELSQAGYQRAAGEVEARNVQRRLLLSPEDRKMFPPFTTSSYNALRDEVGEKMKAAGISLDTTYGNALRPDEHRLRKWLGTEYIDPNTLSPQLKSAWDRLQKRTAQEAKLGLQPHNRQYLGGTEDVPTEKQLIFDTSGKLRSLEPVEGNPFEENP